VGEVGVHFKNKLIGLLECPLEACDVGTPEALFSAAVKDVYAGVFGGYGIGQLSGSVRGIVIHKKDVERFVFPEDSPRDVLDGFTFVIGWYDGQYIVHNAAIIRKNGWALQRKKTDCRMVVFLGGNASRKGREDVFGECFINLGRSELCEEAVRSVSLSKSMRPRHNSGPAVVY